MSFYASYPVTGGSGSAVPTYANLAAFPSAAGAGNGALAIALDTDILYISNGVAWEVLADPTISPFAITALTGDGTATGPGSVPLTLATVNSNVGTFGTASSVSTVTVNAKGLTTAASNTAIQITESQVTNLTTDLAGKVPTTRTISTTAPLTGGGDLSANRTFAITSGNLTDVGTDGIVVTGGTNAVLGAGTSIAQQVSDTTHNGYLSSTDWNTFNNKQSTLTLGNLTDAGTDGIVVTGGTGAVVGAGTSLAQHVADSTHNGYLSSTDWTTFNNKGDVTGPGSAVADHVVFFNGTSGKIIKDSGLTLAGTNTGDVTLTSSAQGLTIAGQALTLALAASGVVGTVSATTQTFTGIKTFETQLIGKGTATNDNAAAGYIGEYTSQTTVAGGILGSSGTVYDATTSPLTLSAGDWDLTLMVTAQPGSAITFVQFNAGISTTSGNSTSGLVLGLNYGITPGSLSADCTIVVANYRVSISGSTDYYAKVFGNYTGGTIALDGIRISARRCR